MAARLSPFIMFFGENHGQAETALSTWVSAFPDSEVLELSRWSEDDENAVAGTISQGLIRAADDLRRALTPGPGRDADGERHEHVFGPVRQRYRHGGRHKADILCHLLCLRQSGIRHQHEKLFSADTRENP